MKTRYVAAAFAVSLLAAFSLTGGGAVPAAHALTYSQLSLIQQRILSGFAAFALQGESDTKPPDNYFPRPSGGCPVNLSSNIKVNQNCLNLTDPDLQGRAQANNETTMAVDPNNTNHLIASSNDYRRGDGNCFSEYSLDGGRTWTDTSIPMQFTRGIAAGVARQYWGAGGDPAVAYDSRGNAYMQCMVFGRGFPTTQNPDLSSAVYVFRSTNNFGASWNFPGRPVIVSQDIFGTGTAAFEDKPYMTIDNHTGSPFQDRIYVTWTEFAPDGSAYIYESHSSDYGEHFSPKVLVSQSSTLCVLTFGAGVTQGTCNENQFSQPFTGPDGNLYVVFDNYNNQPTAPGDNRNQILLAKSVDGGVSFSAPIKVSDFYDLPDCATYQGGKDSGRACVPEKGPSTNSFFRAANYPVGAVNPTNPKQIAVTVGSYINKHSNETNGCVPTGTNPLTGQNLFTGVKTPGACNNDIMLSVSNDAGATFTGTTTDPRALPVVTQDPGQATTDQWWQWEGFTPQGKLGVSYYDRQYGDDESTGFSDVTLSGSSSLVTFKSTRVTSSPNPPPTQFGGTFMGDYTGLAVATNANPLWTDTRNPELFLCPGTGTSTTPPATCAGSAANAPFANDQDIYTANLPVPSG